jgi:N-acetyl-anhydromuramyl-L-alanine amidase AmpD
MIYATARASASDNWAKGPTEKEGVAIHVTEGDRDSVLNWFGNKSADVSSHYLVCTNGARYQFVDEDDIAYHAGRVVSPTARIVLDRPGVNPNRYLIGIEHEGTGKTELTPKQRESSLELSADIMTRHPKIQPDRYHFVGHHEIFAPKSCPGAISVDAYVVALNQRISGTSAPAEKNPRPLTVWSTYFRDWLIVTRVASDDEWYFVPLKQLRAGVVLRAQAPLSSMPLEAPR